MERISHGERKKSKNKAAQNMCNCSQHRSNTQMNKIVHEIDAVRAETNFPPHVKQATLNSSNQLTKLNLEENGNTVSD